MAFQSRLQAISPEPLVRFSPYLSHITHRGFQGVARDESGEIAPLNVDIVVFQ